MNVIPGPLYKRSSFCGMGSCVEVAALPTGDIALRDGKSPNLPPHVFTPDEWDAFVAGVVAGEFDRVTLGLALDPALAARPA